MLFFYTHNDYEHHNSPQISQNIATQPIKLCLICGIPIIYQSHFFLQKAEQKPPNEGRDKEKASLNLPLPTCF